MRGIELRKETYLNMMKLYKNRNNHRITLTGWRWWQCKHWEEFSAKFGAKFRNGDVMMTAVPIHWPSQFTLSCSIRRLYFWFRRLIITSKLDRLCLRWTTRHLTDLFREKLHRLCVRWTIPHLTGLFREKLHCFVFTLNHHSTFDLSIREKLDRLCLRWTIWHLTAYFGEKLHRLCLRWTIRHLTDLFQHRELTHFLFAWIISFWSVLYCKRELSYSHLN